MQDLTTRLEDVRRRLMDWNAECLMVTSDSNRRWLSGFSGSAGFLLVTNDRAIIAADSRYWDQAAIQAPYFEVFKDHRQPENTESLLQSLAVQRVVIEKDHVTLAKMEQLENVGDIQWIPLSDTLESLRQIKSPNELEKIRKSAEITDKAMQEVPNILRPGLTEVALAWELEKLLRLFGASSLAFPTIVAFGGHSARPHHEPGSRALQVGDIVLVDMGAVFEGYCSDLTRTFLYGTGQKDAFLKIFNSVQNSQAAAINATKSGIDTKTPHIRAKDIIIKAGYSQFFGHGLGHSLGLEIHERPFLSMNRPPKTIEAGMVFTFEPGIYIPGWGGIRIEDLGLVTNDGVEIISRAPKIPFIDCKS